MEAPEQTGRAATAAIGGDVDALRLLAKECGSKVLAAASADGSTPAHAAAANGHVDALRFLVEQCGPEVLTAAKADGSSPAHAAAANGRLDVLRFLCEQCGPEVLSAANADGTYLADIAALGGHVGMLRFVSEQCGSEVLTVARANGSTPARAAAFAGHADVLRFLSEQCGSEVLTAARADGVTLAHSAAANSHVDTLRFLVQQCGSEVLTAADEDGWTPAYVAALEGQADTLRFLVETCGSEVLTATIKDGRTPAGVAAANGHVDTLRFLVQQCGSEVLTAADEDGWTPAHAAALEGQADTLRFLVEQCGSEVLSAANANGDTLANAAAHSGHVGVLRFLSEQCGSEVLTAARADGVSTLAHSAAANGHVDTLRFLVQQCGSEVLTAADEDGWTPAHAAAGNGHVDALRYLAEQCGPELLLTASDSKTPALIAAVTGKVDALRFIIDQSNQSIPTAILDALKMKEEHRPLALAWQTLLSSQKPSFFSSRPDPAKIEAALAAARDAGVASSELGRAAALLRDTKLLRALNGRPAPKQLLSTIASNGPGANKALVTLSGLLDPQKMLLSWAALTAVAESPDLPSDVLTPLFSCLTRASAYWSPDGWSDDAVEWVAAALAALEASFLVRSGPFENNPDLIHARLIGLMQTTTPEHLRVRAAFVLSHAYTRGYPADVASFDASDAAGLLARSVRISAACSPPAVLASAAGFALLAAATAGFAATQRALASLASDGTLGILLGATDASLRWPAVLGAIANAIHAILRCEHEHDAALGMAVGQLLRCTGPAALPEPLRSGDWLCDAAALLFVGVCELDTKDAPELVKAARWIWEHAAQSRLLRDRHPWQPLLLQSMQRAADRIEELEARVAQRHDKEDLLQIVSGAVAVAEVATKHCAGGAVDSAPACILSELRCLERTLQNEKFELMVYGVYSVGKSRLLQTGYPSLTKMLPVSDKECTAHLIKIDIGSDGQRGESDAELHFDWKSVVAMDSTLRDLLPDKVRRFLEGPHVREFIDGFLLEGGEQQSPPTLPLSEEEAITWARVDGGSDSTSIKALASVVDHIAVSVTVDATCPQYNIIDAPGLGADESRRAIAERHLRKCDVPIVIASFIDLSLAPLQEALRQIKASGHQPIIVITKLDEQYTRLGEDHPSQDLSALMDASMADARRIFVQAGFRESDVHFVSAYWFEFSKDRQRAARVRAALETAGLPSDEDESTARETLRRLSGIPAFWKAVDELVMRDAARRRAGRVCEELAQHLTKLHCMLLDQDGLLSGVRPNADDPEWCADVQRTSVAAKATLDAALHAMQTECSDAIAESAMRMRDGLTELVLELQKMCAGGSTVDQLSARLQQRFAELQQTLAPHQAWEMAANKMRDHLERAAQEIARHALLARLSDEVYSRHDTGEVLFLKSADNSRVDEQVEVLHFSSAGASTWKVPQWAVFRTAGRADGDFVALVFKGTEAPTEWLVDAACVSREAGGGLKLHAGISGNLRSHIAAVESAIARSTTDAGALPLYFSGHSLGGAYAMCAFYMVAPTLSQRVAGVIGFGAPLVTVAGGPPEIVQAASQRFSTYVAGNDIVPRSLFKPNAEMMVDLARRFGRGRVLFSISSAIPTYDPVGEFRALPGAIQRSPTELLRIRPDAPLTSHIDDHACRGSYARLLDERALELLPSATSTPMAPSEEAAVVMSAAAAAAAATAALAETEARTAGTASIEAPFPTAQQELAQALEASEARSQAAEHRDLAHGIEESLRTDGSSPFASAAAAVQGEAGSMGSSMSTSAAESASAVPASPMSSPRGRAMVELLEEAKLTPYTSVLHDAGYYELTDLREADDVDLGELGLKKPEIKRLRRYLEKQV